MDSMRKDSEWGVIDGEPCKVIEFTPLATIKQIHMLWLFWSVKKYHNK